MHSAPLTVAQSGSQQQSLSQLLVVRSQLHVLTSKLIRALPLLYSIVIDEADAS